MVWRRQIHRGGQAQCVVYRQSPKRSWKDAEQNKRSKNTLKEIASAHRARKLTPCTLHNNASAARVSGMIRAGSGRRPKPHLLTGGQAPLLGQAPPVRFKGVGNAERYPTTGVKETPRPVTDYKDRKCNKSI